MKMTRQNEWFTVDKIDDKTFIVSEYRHPEETHCYLLIGNDSCLLIDTGLGIGNIYDSMRALTDKPIAAIATHAHWDHIGGHKYFPEFYVHGAEAAWLNGNFPLPVQAVRKMVADGCDLPDDFDIDGYEIFKGVPARVMFGGETIGIGGRTVEVLHTPGHSPGHMCFWERERGYLFCGDLIYKGTLFAHYPSTDPNAYLRSLEAVAALPSKRLFPAHHSLSVSPALAIKMRDALRELKRQGDLRHGAGTFDRGDFAIKL